MRHQFLAAALAAFALLAAVPNGQDTKALKGTVRIDGSSTVYPITEAAAEEFSKVAEKVNVTVGVSGTGGGFKRFGAGELDVADASRCIKKAELEAAKARSIEFIELPVAFDGLTIVVNKGNTWVKQLTVAQVKKLYSAADPAKTWKDVDPSWPAQTIKLYSPGTDSGTFDYFREVVVGKDGKIRADLSVSEDDNVLVKGVAGDVNAIGFFGFAYYMENKEQLACVPVVNPTTGAAVVPTHETIEKATYAPFSRPLFIYVNKGALDKPQVRAFVDFYLANAAKLAEEVGYVKLPAALSDRAKANLAAGKTGTQMLDENGKERSGALADLYK